MKIKIEVNEIEFNLSNIPSYLDEYRYCFNLICVKNEVDVIKNWHFNKDVFWFEPFSSNVCIERIESKSYGCTYDIRLTLARVMEEN